MALADDTSPVFTAQRYEHTRRHVQATSRKYATHTRVTGPCRGATMTTASSRAPNRLFRTGYRAHLPSAWIPGP